MSKHLSPVQEVFGDAYAGGCQKRYRHKRQYGFERDGKKLLGFVETDTPNKEAEKEQLLEWIAEFNADKVTLRWSAVIGFPSEDLVVWTVAEGFVNEGVFI